MTPGTELTKLGDGLYTYRWVTYRTMFLVTDEGVLVFDPLNKGAAGNLSEHIDRVAPDKKIRYVVYSHGHRDHASGVDELGGDPTILAHRDAADDIEARGYRDVRLPTETFDKKHKTLEFGGETIRLIRVPGAHGRGLIVSYFPDRDLLYAVDLVWPNQLPPPGAPLSFTGSQSAVDQLLSLEFETFVPGHGSVAKRDAVREYGKFLDDLEREFREALERHDMGNFHERETFTSAPDEVGDVFFEVIDALEPTYGHFENYDEAMLSTVQWCMWAIVTGE